MEKLTDYLIYQRHDKRMEAVVLASVMNDALHDPKSGLADEMLTNLTMECFTSPEHLSCYEAIRATRENGLPAHVANVSVYIPRVHKDILAEFTSHSTVSSIGPQVKELAMLRKTRGMQNAMDKAFKAIMDEESPAKAVGLAQQELLKALEDDLSGAEGRLLKEAIPDYLSAKKDKAQGIRNGVLTGIHEFDRQTGGLHGGQLVIVAALQKMGKSNFTTTIANNIDQSGGAVAMFTGEMTEEEILDRFVSQRTMGDRELSNRALFLGNSLGREHLVRLNGVLEDVSNNSQAYIYASHCIDINVICSHSRRRKADGKLDAIFIDYLQIMLTDPNREREEITGVTRTLKKLAQELDVPVVLLSQINARDMKVGQRPSKGMLKGSSSIESDADIIIFPWREQAINNDPDMDAGYAELIIGGARGAQVADVKMRFCTNTTKFYEERR